MLERVFHVLHTGRLPRPFRACWIRFVAPLRQLVRVRCCRIYLRHHFAVRQVLYACVRLLRLCALLFARLLGVLLPLSLARAF